jgi:hypothetical protein
MPKLSDALFGKKGKSKQLTTQTPEQDALLKLINEGLTNGEGPLKDIFGDFDPAAFEAGVSKPAIQQFQDEILPMLQEKYIAGNQTLGSGAQRAGAKAATDLQSKLAQLMYEAQNQQKQNKISGVNTALGTKAFENIYKPGTEGALSGFVKGAGQGLGNAAGSGIANGAADLGNWVKGIIAG